MSIADVDPALKSIPSEGALPLEHDESAIGNTHAPDSETVVAIEDTAHQLPETTDTAKKEKWLRRAINVGRSAVIFAEVTPANEAMRLAVFGAAMAATGEPAIGALAYGGSTLAIESSAGMATAGALDTGTAQKAVNFVNGTLEKVGVGADAKTSATTKAAATVLGGTSISMVLKHRENPERTRDQNRRYGFFTAAALSGVCAVQGYLMGKGVAVPSLETIGGGVGALAGTQAAARQIIKRAKRNRERLVDEAGIENYNPEFDLRIGLTHNKEEIEKALVLEQKIWDENKFGSLEEYEKYRDQSRVFTAFKGDTCVGITRMFAGGPELPPFTELPFDNKKEYKRIVKACKNGDMEELGTAAVDHSMSGAPRNIISLDMWRLAYRDARARGIKTWGIIMEPERVERMNEHFGFTFKQLGPAESYQGGDCAAFEMDLEEVDRQMKESIPELHKWFVEDELTPAPSLEAAKAA